VEIRKGGKEQIGQDLQDLEDWMAAEREAIMRTGMGCLNPRNPRRGFPPAGNESGECRTILFNPVNPV
jgi:hypothetical protein